MNYALNETQAMLRRSIRDVLERECPISRVREIEASDSPYDASLWRRLGRLGMLELGIVRKGESFVDGLVLAEELGRAIAPIPFASSIVASGGLLAGSGKHAAIFADLLAGEIVCPFAISDDLSNVDPWNSRSLAIRRTSDVALVGPKSFVEALPTVGPLVFVTKTDNQIVRAYLVDASLGEVTYERTTAGDLLGSIFFEGALAEEVGGRGPSVDRVYAAIDRARIAHAANICGMAARSLEMAIDYAKTRIQFGRPIGSFQTLQHRLADLTTSLEATRFLTYHAGWTVDQGVDFDVAAAMALHSAIDVAEQLAIETAHIFGGYGVSVDTDIQLYYRRLRAAEVRWGDAGQLLETVASKDLDPV